MCIRDRFRTRGKKVDANVPNIVFDENERDCPFNPDFVTILERYHNNHQKSDGQAYKLLGVYLDEHLTFDAHVNHLCKKFSRSIYCIKMAKNNINPPGLRALYFALIHSHLSYCPIILNCTSKSNITKIEKLQKRLFVLFQKIPTMPILHPFSLNLKFCHLKK